MMRFIATAAAATASLSFKLNFSANEAAIIFVYIGIPLENNKIAQVEENFMKLMCISRR